jgi:soluble lytic murein transglycosylase
MSSLIQRAAFPALFAVLVLALFFGEAGAGMYQCTDEQGGLLFTNSPARGGCRLLGGLRDDVLSQIISSSNNSTRFDDLIVSSSERYGIDPALVRAVVKAESDFNETARSRKGAQGLMQLMPDTARLYNISNAYNPEENIEGGVRHLKLLLDRYQGNVQLTLAAYNAGIQAVEKYRGIPPYSETKEYVRRVLDFHQRYRKDGQIAASEDRRERE